jgi:hypothetical protein
LSRPALGKIRRPSLKNNLKQEGLEMWLKWQSSKPLYCQEKKKKKYK